MAVLYPLQIAVHLLQCIVGLFRHAALDQRSNNINYWHIVLVVLVKQRGVQALLTFIDLSFQRPYLSQFYSVSCHQYIYMHVTVITYGT